MEKNKIKGTPLFSKINLDFFVTGMVYGVDIFPCGGGNGEKITDVSFFFWTQGQRKAFLGLHWLCATGES